MLNNRQQKLYEYLVNNEGKVILKSHIVDDLEGLYNPEERKDNSKSHTILDDIKTINDDATCEKIILYKNNKIKVATKEEAEEYCIKFYKKGLIAMKHYGSLKRKIASHNQGNLTYQETVLLEFIDRFSKI